LRRTGVLLGNLDDPVVLVEDVMGELLPLDEVKSMAS
jgi:hypothetical protein